MSVNDKDTPNVELDVKELNLEVLPPLPDEVKDSKPLETATEPIDIPPKKEHLEGNTQMEILLKKIEELEERARPKPKKKREVSEKQREALAKAREKRNQNMVKRKQIKKELKIEEKKIVNEKLEEEKNVSNKQNDDIKKPDDILPPPETNRIINNNEVPENYHRQPPRGNPNASNGSVMAYQQQQNIPRRRIKLSERLGLRAV
jgi:hypothetical protein